MTNYKLIYFNVRGRGEVIRLIFAYAGIKYEDVRIEDEDWPKHKQNMLYFQMPILEVDGKVLAQSGAIAMYLARKYGLAGENDWEAAKVQEMLGVLDDVISAGEAYFEPENAANREKAMPEFEKNRLVPILKRLDEILAKNGTGYFVGDKLTAADFAVLHMTDWFSQDFPHSMDGLNHLKEFHGKIAAIPAIKNWLETRPKTVI